MNNRRLCALVLLAAFALLQARVALAGCLNDAAPIGAGMSCCAAQAPAESVSHTPADLALVCEAHCLRPYAVQTVEPDQLLVSTPAFSRPSTPRPRMDLSGVPLPLVLAAAHPAHTHLIYVLQRLLI
jgi:hypothetical protein